MAFLKQVLFVLAVVATAQALTAARAGAWAGGFTNANGFQGLNLPQPPALPIFGQFNLPGFGNIHLPTPEDIARQVANAKPGENGQYSGIVASSITGVTQDKDGNIVRTGGSTIMTNDNGVVKTFEVGDNPPVLRSVPLQQQQQQKNLKPEEEDEHDDIYDPFNIFKNDPFFKPSKFKAMKFEPITWEPIVFEPIKPINPDEIRNYKPGDNEHYVSHYTSLHSESSDVNGVKKNSGKVESIVNINGKVKEDSIVYDSDSDKQKKENE